MKTMKSNLTLILAGALVAGLAPAALASGPERLPTIRGTVVRVHPTLHYAVVEDAIGFEHGVRVRQRPHILVRNRSANSGSLRVGDVVIMRGGPAKTAAR